MIVTVLLSVFLSVLVVCGLAFGFYLYIDGQSHRR
ncbi:hypothetical protein HNQ77_002186 [Silvibacterium bohemicum]|uniref:Uncharacterized protein n=1 Tax=Silvibacterium bohemicum TaxID=1577686 RepID=A0A841K1X1_9BACT|nr:hypothetical protein [Silvibacterium bohemicum]